MPAKIALAANVGFGPCRMEPAGRRFGPARWAGQSSVRRAHLAHRRSGFFDLVDFEQKFPLFVDLSFYDAGAAFSNITWSGGMATDVKITVGELVQFTTFKGVSASTPGQLRKLTTFGGAWNVGAESKYEFEQANKNNISGVSVQVLQTNANLMIGLH